MEHQVMAERSTGDGLVNAIMENAPVGVAAVDPSMQVIYWSRTIEVWTNVAPCLAVGTDLRSIFPEIGCRRYQLRLEELVRSGAPVIFHSSIHTGLLDTPGQSPGLNHYRVTCRRTMIEGSSAVIVMWVENMSLLDETIGYLRAEIAARRRAEDEAREAAASRDALYRELQHRVKNSLAMIGSLLSLSRQDACCDDVRGTLSDVEARITSIALVYDELAVGGRYGRLDLSGYLRNLVDSLVGTYACPPGMREPVIELAPCSVPIDVAVPLGLIVNELVTNSMKHAFPEGATGSVRLTLTGGQPWALVVSDDGVGSCAQVEAAGAGRDRFGLTICRLLADQIGATFERLPGAGTSYRLTFTIVTLPSI